MRTMPTLPVALSAAESDFAHPAMTPVYMERSPAERGAVPPAPAIAPSTKEPSDANLTARVTSGLPPRSDVMAGGSCLLAASP